MGRFCLFSFIFQLPFYTLVFSEWGCFFNLLCLLTPPSFGHLPYILLRKTQGERVIPSVCCCYSRCFQLLCFINPLALWALPLYRCTTQGERLRFDFVAVAFLLPPLFFNPSVTTCHLPYILLRKTPRNAAGHGKGGV